ncbi:MAG: hypothetical protein HFE85_00205, partial [Clostridiales bacterium]|nr:hypothetical protein [Clostridiales bacterium]
MVLYFLDQDEKIIGSMDQQIDNRIASVVLSEPEMTLDFSLFGSAPEMVSEAKIVGVYDTHHVQKLFEIRSVTENHTGRNLTCDVHCEDVLYELQRKIVPYAKLKSATLQTALQVVLSGTGWGYLAVGSYGLGEVEFSYQSVLSCLQVIEEKWNVRLSYSSLWGESAGSIYSRKILVSKKTELAGGRRFEWKRDMTEVRRVVDRSRIVTALYGRGKARRVAATKNSPAYSERVDITAAVWQTPSDPANKPLGQEWVGDEVAKARWGCGAAGSKQHLFAVATFPQIDDPEELLTATWAELQLRKQPDISYTIKAADMERLTGLSYERIRIGSTVSVIDDGFSPPLEANAVVTQVKWDLTDPMNTVIVLGTKPKSLADIVEQLEKDNNRLTEKEDVYDQIASNLGDSGGVDTSRLEGAIDVLQNCLVASGSFQTAVPVDGKGILLENNQQDSAGYGAMYLGPGMMAIANTKTDGKWNWRTFGTGTGFTADEIVTGNLDAALVTTGRLQSSNGQSWMDLEDGSFSFGGEKLMLSGSGDVTLKGELVCEKSGKQVYISASEMGWPMIGFMVGGDGAGYL